MIRKLAELIGILESPEITGDIRNADIKGITSDSRQTKEGSLFVAIKGTGSDGHDYIKSALAKGAVCIVCEVIPSGMEEEEDSSGKGIVFIKVKDSSDALGKLAACWYGFPSDKLTVVGVTGTNGKTTIATLLYKMFRVMGYKAGLISTVCNYIDDKTLPTSHTTPDALTLQSLMARMVEAGCTYVFMEVSSHAIDQKRISGISFNGGIFTNLTRDHLDYHGTVDNYLKAKKKFFDDLPAPAFALTNIDDKTGSVMLQNTAARKLTYSLTTLADFKGKILESHFDGTDIILNNKEVMVHFVGRFNTYNLLAVYGAAVALGKQPEEVLLVLSTLKPVAGRFETFRSPSGYMVIVDYAHTPDALANVLNSLFDVLTGNGRIITVVGAGGNRDKGKRPLMAKEAVKGSDLVIFTSDNPRFEEPDDIIKDMLAGLSPEETGKTLSIADRTQAIKAATMFAKKGDIILIAGKGHEDYQEIKGIRYPFDDRKKVREIFATQQQA
jgi:UDP-N-acetylmuramoyl-L-alanyl-D-glutamate--2,6-diaminopimelate ligase